MGEIGEEAGEVGDVGDVGDVVEVEEESFLLAGGHRVSLDAARPSPIAYS